MRWRSILMSSGLLVIAIAVVVGAADVIHQARYRKVVSRLLHEVKIPAAASVSEKADLIRSFIFDHSTPKMDEIFYATWRDPVLLAQLMLDHASGTSREPAHMECSARSGLMVKMLESEGVATRRIDIYDSRTMLSHSFLEAWDPDRNRWETHDPLHDVVWRSVTDGEKVSVVEAAEALDTVQPCGRNACGRHAHLAKQFGDFLDYIAIVEKARGLRYTIYSSRADVSKPVTYRENVGRYCDVIGKNCEDGFYRAGAVPFD